MAVRVEDRFVGGFMPLVLTAVLALLLEFAKNEPHAAYALQS